MIASERLFSVLVSHGPKRLGRNQMKKAELKLRPKKKNLVAQMANIRHDGVSSNLHGTGE